MQQQTNSHKPILITGATGNVGREVVNAMPPGVPLRIAARGVDEAKRMPGEAHPIAAFDFEKTETLAPALAGVSRVFLMRPPQMNSATKMLPFLDAAKAAGVEQIVFLSLLGAEKNRVVPHRGIEDAINAGGIPHVFLRASFFMQNLTTQHLDEVRAGEIRVPAGRGATSFIDVRDIGAVAAHALTTPVGESRALDLTGSEALTYDEVATLISEATGKTVRYTRPGLFRFVRDQLQAGKPLPFVLVMAGIYTTCRLGRAARVTGDVARVLGRLPITFRQFAHDYAVEWL